MKAVDYLKRFDHIDDIITHDRKEVLQIMDKILVDMFLETAEIIKQREARLNNSVISVIKEQDKKFQSLCRRLDKKYNKRTFKENAFISCLIQKVPELSKYLTGWK